MSEPVNLNCAMNSLGIYIYIDSKYQGCLREILRKCLLFCLLHRTGSCGEL